MAQIEDHLTQIKDRMATGERDVPERLLKDLIGQMGRLELSDWRVDIMHIADQFQKRRRKNIQELLNEAISGNSKSPDQEPGLVEAVELPPAASATSLSLLSKFEGDFRKDLTDLHERHIFQWATFYRDCLADYFSRFLDEVKHSSSEDLFTAISDPLAEHAHVAFTKGYDHIRTRSAGDPFDRNSSPAARNPFVHHDPAIRKSINGLSRFLALPLEFYSARSSAVSGYHPTLNLRELVSAAVSGILAGYSRVQFDGKLGSEILPRFQRQWAPYMTFLTPHHAKSVIDSLAPGPLQDGLNLSVLPLLDGLQRFFERVNEDYWPVPVAGQYSWHRRRLSISIRSPRSAVSQRPIEIAAFLEGGFVEIEDLKEADGRQMALVLAPLKPDVRKIVNDQERLKAIIVPVRQNPADTEGERNEDRRIAANSAFQFLDKALYALRSRLEANSPITYNFAREFPLRDPHKAKFFHVPRTSVRDLLRTFERRNGVRLWCSVRRSGKTTACLDMESTTGDSIIIPQTCGASQDEEARVFYQKVREAVATNRIISEAFVRETVAECAQITVGEGRTVLILDEYETLFGLLRSAAKDDAAARYNVVQPILDQLAGFSRDNLLVFLGQQPDAHFILMDQNQLAPYVTQDSFPMFEHVTGTATGEFSELVKKILAERIECSAGFLDALFQETAGHPYLTANVLVEFVWWLIEKKRPQLGLQVREEDFANFSRKMLDTNAILQSLEYEFFRHAVAEALSTQGYHDNPWLFATYWILRLISNEDSSGFRITRADFEELANRIPVPKEGCLPECAEMLRTATNANFLSQDREYVSVRIRTLGRVAVSVQPALA